MLFGTFTAYSVTFGLNASEIPLSVKLLKRPVLDGVGSGAGVGTVTERVSALKEIFSKS